MAESAPIPPDGGRGGGGHDDTADLSRKIVGWKITD